MAAESLAEEALNRIVNLQSPASANILKATSEGAVRRHVQDMRE